MFFKKLFIDLFATLAFFSLNQCIFLGVMQICLMLISAAFAGEEKTIKKRGLTLGGWGLGGLDGLDGGWGGKGVAIAVQHKAVPVAVPHPVPVVVDRPYPVKVRINYFNFSRR